MHFRVKIVDKGRKNIFRDKETINKALLRFLDVKSPDRKVIIVFLHSVNKQARYSFCI